MAAGARGEGSVHGAAPPLFPHHRPKVGGVRGQDRPTVGGGGREVGPRSELPGRDAGGRSRRGQSDGHTDRTGMKILKIYFLIIVLDL